MIQTQHWNLNHSEKKKEKKEEKKSDKYDALSTLKILPACHSIKGGLICPGNQSTHKSVHFNLIKKV